MPPPPPPPLYLGTHVSARIETPAGGRAPLLSLRPRNGHAFSLPRGTTVLYLPHERLVSVDLADLGEDTASVTFSGEFSRVDRPREVTLAPVSLADARALVAVLRRRLGLPRQPADRSTEELGGVAPHELVKVIDRVVVRAHAEGANFGPVRLELPPGQALTEDAVVTAVGFVDPPAAGPSRGWSGAVLRALWVEVHAADMAS